VAADTTSEPAAEPDRDFEGEGAAAGAEGPSGDDGDDAVLVEELR
jgi:hypothetical protein